MSKFLLTLAAALLTGLPSPAQERLISVVRGEILSEENLIGNNLTVQLQGLDAYPSAQQVFVLTDGSFEFHGVRPGSYILRVLRTSQDPLVEVTMNLVEQNGLVQVRLPKQANAVHANAGKVSVGQLRHPPSKHAIRVFAKAQHYSDSGDHDKAIDELRRVVGDSTAEGYARGILGAEYVRTGRPEAAIAELEQAVRLLPDSLASHTNLAYALSLTRQYDRAEQEARRALQIDRSDSRAHYLLGHSLLLRGGEQKEAIENLKLACREIPRARVVLAQAYARSGQKTAAAAEIREYLPDAHGADRIQAERWLAVLESDPR